MNQPWGLSGPQFLGLYVLALIVSLALVPLIRLPLRGGVRREAPVDVYTAAALAGGANRVVDTAVYALVGYGRLRTTRNHSVSVCAGRASEPLQQAVLDSFGPRKSARLTEIRKFAGATREVQQVCAQAVANGLLLSAGRRRALRLAVLLPFAVLVVGVVRTANGLQLHRPVANLVALLLLTVPVLLVVAIRVPRTTRAGAGLVRAARRSPADNDRVGTSYASTGALVPTAVVAVAALGAAGIEDQALRAALFGNVAGSGDSSASSSGCGSSGSSCGGGGGCGG